MAYTRDWDKTTPVDHTKFKAQPGHVRDAKEDIEERLKNILYGVTTGETYEGFKKVPFIITGTGAPTAPSGTGNALNIEQYIRKVGTGTTPDMYAQSATGWSGELRLTRDGKLALDSGELPNDTYLKGLDSGNANAIDIIKVNTGNALEFASAPVGDYIVKAWIQFNGTGTPSITDSFNVSSITDRGVGTYTITWDTDFANNDYAFVGSADLGGIISFGTVVTTGYIYMNVANYNNDAYDSTIINAIAIGDQ